MRMAVRSRGQRFFFETTNKGQPEGAYQCEVKTKPDGSFGCGFTHEPWNVKLRLTITKEGFKTYVRELFSNDLAKSQGGNMGTHVITLERN